MLFAGQTTLPPTRCPVKSQSTRRQTVTHRVCAQALAGTPTWTAGGQHAPLPFQNPFPQHLCHKDTKKDTWSRLTLKPQKQVGSPARPPSDRGRESGPAAAAPGFGRGPGRRRGQRVVKEPPPACHPPAPRGRSRRARQPGSIASSQQSHQKRQSRFFSVFNLLQSFRRKETHNPKGSLQKNCLAY